MVFLWKLEIMRRLGSDKNTISGLFFSFPCLLKRVSQQTEPCVEQCQCLPVPTETVNGETIRKNSAGGLHKVIKMYSGYCLIILVY